MIRRVAEMPNQDAREEHASRAEPDPTELETTECHPKHTYTCDGANGVRDRLRPMKFEQPIHASHFGGRGFHFRARTRDVGFEVFVKEARELFGRRIIGGFF